MILEPELKKYFLETPIDFTKIMALKGEVYRKLEGRCTQRIRLGNQVYFIKQHRGVGWKEIFKNLFQLRLPVLSAKNEWQALQKLHQLNIATLKTVGYGRRGYNPAKLESFLITRELANKTSLEIACKEWQRTPPLFNFKIKLIKQVATIAKTLHQNGINHRDFYICHFLLDQENTKNLYLIDLHRAQIRTHTPERWIIKDIAALYFSSKDIGLTKKDLFRFIKEYTQKPLRETLTKDATFWLKIKKRGDQLYEHEYRQ